MTLDTHLDTPANFVNPAWDILSPHNYRDDLSQVDYPRLLKGGLDGGFWAIFTPQGARTIQGQTAARDTALLTAARIREMVAAHPAQFELALRSTDAAAIAARGKRIVYLSIENSYPLGDDPTLLEAFYALGVRMVGPVHVLNNQFADSSTDARGKEWGGLSPLGRRLVSEANRLGIIVDASHASNDVFDQLLTLSKTPPILSHSSCSALFEHPRNIDDDRLRRLAAAGGVIQLNSLSDYLIATPPNPERKQALQRLVERLGRPNALDPVRRAEFARARQSIDRAYPSPRATVDDFIRHLLHALAVAGPEHVGIGADWDGGGGVDGLDDVSDIPKITERLLAAGYSEPDLANIWSGNVLRLLRLAEEARSKE